MLLQALRWQELLLQDLKKDTDLNIQMHSRCALS